MPWEEEDSSCAFFPQGRILLELVRGRREDSDV